MSLNTPFCKKCVTGKLECISCTSSYCEKHFSRQFQTCLECISRDALNTSAMTVDKAKLNREVQRKIRLENGAIKIAASVANNIKVTKQGVAKSAVEVALEVQELIWGKDDAD